MKTRYFAERPAGARAMCYRNLPWGTVVLDRYAYWGVVENGWIDRWDAPPRRFEKNEVVLLMHGKPALRKGLRTSASPSDGKLTITRVALSPCPKSGR